MSSRLSWLIATGCLLFAHSVANAAAARFIYYQRAADEFDVYFSVTNGPDTDGLSSYSIYVNYNAENGLYDDVQWTQNNLKAITNLNGAGDGDDVVAGFWRPLEPGETHNDVNRPSTAPFAPTQYNIANTQFDSAAPIAGVGKTAVSVAAVSGPSVNLGAPALLGTINLPGGSGTVLQDFSFSSTAGLFQLGGANAGNPQALSAGSIALSELYTQSGDFNLDGIISGLDIQGFIDAFTNESQFKTNKGLTNGEFLLIADINSDSVFSGLDIDPFVDLLTGGGASAGEVAMLLSAVPEPGLAGTMAVLLGGMVLRRSGRGQKF